MKMAQRLICLHPYFFPLPPRSPSISCLRLMLVLVPAPMLALVLVPMLVLVLRDGG